MIESSQAIFIIPSQNTSQQEIILRRINQTARTLWDESDEDEPAPQFSCYNPIVKYMIERMGYDFIRKEGLKYGKGRKMPLRPAYVPKGKLDNFYCKTRRGLGYSSSSSELHCNFDEIHNSHRDGLKRV